MATTFGVRFFTLFRPVVSLPFSLVRRKPVRRERYHLVVRERMAWHPSLGYRPVTEYEWLPLGPEGDSKV